MHSREAEEEEEEEEAEEGKAAEEKAAEEKDEEEKAEEEKTEESTWGSSWLVSRTTRYTTHTPQPEASLRLQPAVRVRDQQYTSTR